MKVTLFKCCLALLVIGMILTGTGLAYACTCPTIYDNNVIDYAKTGVGSPYWWGHGCWKTTDRNWGGADCSGFAAKCWQVPEWTATTTDVHPYTTANFFNDHTHWYDLNTNRSTMWKSDVLVYRTATSGHIVIYYYGDPWNTPSVYEARGEDYGIVFNARNFNNTYKPIRRHNLIQTAGPG